MLTFNTFKILLKNYKEEKNLLKKYLVKNTICSFIKTLTSNLIFFFLKLCQ